MIESDTPLYQQIHDAIRNRVASGELRAGVMLPSEAEIGRSFGASQGTARKALSALERAGILERRQGKGTFVATTTTESELFHFFRLRNPDGSAALPELARETLTRRRATAAERQAFDLPDLTHVHDIQRDRQIAGTMRIRETIALPAPLFPGLDEHGALPNTLYVLYQDQFGLAIVRADETIAPTGASPEDAAAFGVAVGTPLLQVDRRAMGISDQVIELRRSLYLTGNLGYAVSLR